MRTQRKVLIGIGSGLTAALAAGAGFMLLRRRQQKKRERQEWLHS
jgi:hypothetical protein